MSVAAEICGVCGSISLEVRGFCPVCGARDCAPGMVMGEGVIWSVTRIYRPPSIADGVSESYSVALIALATGPRLMARVPNNAVIGQRVSVSRELIDEPDTYVLLLDI